MEDEREEEEEEPEIAKSKHVGKYGAPPTGHTKQAAEKRTRHED
jgi:hypothetical protein